MNSSDIFLSRLRRLLTRLHITTSAKKNILIIGLDASGKTTLINKLADGRPICMETPTIGLHIEVLKLRELTFTTINLPCTNSDKTFVLTRHYYQKADAVIWIVPKNHAGCLADAERRLQYVLKHLPHASLLVLCNQSESECPIDANEEPSLSLVDIKEQISMFKSLDRSDWQYFDVDLMNGQGLREALEWLEQDVRTYSVNHTCLKHLRSFKDIMKNDNF